MCIFQVEIQNILLIYIFCQWSICGGKISYILNVYACIIIIACTVLTWSLVEEHRVFFGGVLGRIFVHTNKTFAFFFLQGSFLMYNIKIRDNKKCPIFQKILSFSHKILEVFIYSNKIKTVQNNSYQFKINHVLQSNCNIDHNQKKNNIIFISKYKKLITCCNLFGQLIWVSSKNFLSPFFWFFLVVFVLYIVLG
eukprot:TRINITY_DN5837_c1_g1_i1.p1 TRINITY_DN5837_c1_g1~~TRINITY_DN5837_c1_g1_i1.p1  ORF type:complete len:225 (-),score=-7.63 TRINITY_DN5837_c1_g1_i1:413-997(-)